MNDIVFAGTQKALCAADTGKFLKCLKVIVAENGEYTVVPPNHPFNGEDFPEEALAVCLEQPLSPSSRIRTSDNKGRQGVLNAVRQAAMYFGEKESAGVLAALGELIISYVTDDLQENTHPIANALKAEIDGNFSDGTYSVDASINKLPLNYDYVRKLFKKNTGLTPHEYLMQVRMKRAQAIITSGVTNRYSNYTVSQIAEACGFTEPLYFSRVFKKYFGTSPSRYISDALHKTNEEI